MRSAFLRTLADIAEQDSRIMLLTGDLGFMAVEPFAERFPDRFINVGVAEQNMVGLATGLAEAGFIPFVYSIAPFATLRPYEFIRNGPLLHRLPVRVVGIGGGLEYASNGATHFGLEDVGLMRMQPGMTVLTPADAPQASAALRASWDLPGPIYFRVGKDDRTRVPGLDGRFALGEAQCIRTGADIVLIAMGALASEAAKAAELLAAGGIEAMVIVISCLQPAPVADLALALANVPAVCSIEGHYVTGGIGSLIAEIIAERGLRCQLVRCGVASQPDGVTGSTAWLHARHGLTAVQLAETARLSLRMMRV